MECVAAIEELNAQMKELQQTKLDNIQSDFEAIAGYAEAVSSTSESMINLYTAQGKVVNSSKYIKAQMQSQMDQQKKLTETYQAEMKAYKEELKSAARIFGESSIEYQEALTAYQEMQQAVYESKTEYLNLNKALRELDLTKIEYVIDRLTAFGDKLQSILSLKELRGAGIGESDYTKQISNNNTLIDQYYDDIQRRIRIIAEEGWAKDSENYKEYYDAISSDEQKIYDLLESNENLKKSIRELRWKPFVELEKRLDEAISDYEHLRGLFKEAQFFDEFGEGINLTNKGLANLALLASELFTAKRQLSDYRRALDKLQQELKSGNITQDEFNEYSREYISTIQSGVNDIENYKEAIASMYKTQIQNENNMLQELIDKRKEALGSTKSYYDYLKQIREKQTDINTLKAQIQALQGVTNDAGKAQLKRLEADLAERQQDLNDTVYDHQYDMTVGGYDKLSKDADEALQDTLNELEANTQAQEKVVNMMLDKVSGSYKDAYSAIEDIIVHTGTVVDSTADKIIDRFQKTADIIKAAQVELNAFKDNASQVVDDINTSPIVTVSTGQTTGMTTTEIEAKVNKKTETRINEAKKEVEAARAAEAAAKAEAEARAEAARKAAEAQAKAEEAAKKTSTGGSSTATSGTGGGTPVQPKTSTSTTISAGDKVKYASGRYYGSSTGEGLSGNYGLGSDVYVLKVNDASWATHPYLISSTQDYSGGLGWVTKDQLQSYTQAAAPTSSTAPATSAGDGDGEIRVGDQVTYASGSYYGSSQGSGASGNFGLGGKVYVLKINDADWATHPYLISTTKDYSGGLGWVSRNQLKGYASGVKRLKQDELAWTNEAGRELVISPRDGAILTPLKAGDSVIPSALTDNLFKWGEINPDKFNVNPFMGKWKESSATAQQEKNQVVNYYDSLIHIDGNVDENVMGDLRAVVDRLLADRSFQKGVVNVVSKDMTRESRKIGMR